LPSFATGSWQSLGYLPAKRSPNMFNAKAFYHDESTLAWFQKFNNSQHNSSQSGAEEWS
jgi:myosin-crossreactive antigen